MFIFRIRITMSDGSSGRCTGLFTTACAAVRTVLSNFPGAVSVSAICLRGGA